MLVPINFSSIFFSLAFGHAKSVNFGFSVSNFLLVFIPLKSEIIIFIFGVHFSQDL